MSDRLSYNEAVMEWERSLEQAGVPLDSNQAARVWNDVFLDLIDWNIEPEYCVEMFRKEET